MGFAEQNPRLASLIERDKAAVWHPFSHASLEGPPISVKRARGSWLIAEDGRHYLDAVSSWWVNTHGHCNPVIAEAIAKQLYQLEHCIFAGFTHEPAVELAELLLSILPENQEKIFFSDNGSTAVEVALKLAIQFNELRSNGDKEAKRRTLVRLSSSYHGDTVGAMSVSERDTFTAPFTDYLFEVAVIPTPTEDNISEVTSQFELLCSKSDTLAFIFEPLIQGAGGMVMYSAEHLDRLFEIAKQHNVVLIADEVMTGFGRTGTHFATLQTKHEPDILCLSKGITGGFLPLGATSCSGEIVEAFHTPDRGKFFYHGHSYTGNPLACAAGVASTKLLLEERCQERIAKIQELHTVAIKDFSSCPGLTRARVTGTVLAVDIDCGEDSYYLNPIRDKLYTFFLERGILLRPLGNVVYILPPYCFTDSELGSCYQAIAEAGREFGKAA
ncbi:MAG: adenosylmethionine--8-amino-7-oxononanoate transaminase [Bdellovibrionales bacterium]|nr:adenosylmethionine--8-amino-7-oxononanoate transaminase [Bdellovibrionales bacterium]